MPTSESSPEKKSDTKNISDKKTFETVDLPLPPLKSLDATRAQEIGALSGFERTVLQSKVDPKKEKEEPKTKEEQGIMDSIHSAFASLSVGAKQGGSLLESGGKGASLGALTYLSLKISQSILNAGKGTWYGLKTLGAWTKNILHYLSFGYIAKAQPVEAPQYFTFGDDITKTLGGIVPFTTLGAVGGMGAGTDILEKGKEFVNSILKKTPSSPKEVSPPLPLPQKNLDKPLSDTEYQKVITLPKHQELQTVGKSVGARNDIIKSALYICWREMTGEPDIWIRTKSNPEKDNSTAYGPMQLTKSLAQRYVSSVSEIFSAEEKVYLQKFIAHGNKMNSASMDSDPIYGYGKKGEAYFYSSEGRTLYYQVCLKIWGHHVKEAKGDFKKALAVWRGRSQTQDPRYFSYLNAFMERAKKG